MAVTSVEPWRPPMAVWRRMVELGVLEDERVELLDGLITPMSPKGVEHEHAIAFLTRLLVESVDRSYEVRVQSALSLGDGWEPEPDLALVRPGTAAPYHPGAPDWVGEVAMSSLSRDRGIKREAYARAEVPEFWLVALPERRVVVDHAPSASAYTQTLTQTEGTLTSPTVPGLVLDVDALWRAAFGER